MSSTAPTLTRYFILATLCGAASVAYLCRNSIGVAESTIRADLKLTEHQIGTVTSSFFLAYAIGQIPLGWLGQQLGARRGIALFAAGWSVATALMSAASGALIMPVLVATRVANGIAQAGLFPACTASVGRWFPSGNRAFANGSLASCMSIGNAIGVAVTGVLVASIGWRFVFVVYGAVGLLFAIVFYLLFRNSPAEHTWVNDQERKLIGDTAEAAKPGDVNWGIYLSTQTWWICGQQFCRAAGQIFFSSWFATYLQETRGVSVADSGILNSMPLLGIVAGAFLGGSISDFVLRRTGELRLARTGVAVASMTTCAACVLMAFFIENPLLAVGTITLGTFFAAIGGPCAYTVTIDMGGRSVAILFATMNMIGNLGAYAFIKAVPYILPYSGWDAVLMLFGGLYLGAAGFWLLINPNRSIDVPLQEAEE